MSLSFSQLRFHIVEAVASRASGSELGPVVNIVGRSVEATILLPVSGRELGKLSALVEATLDPTTNFNFHMVP